MFGLNEVVVNWPLSIVVAVVGIVLAWRRRGKDHMARSD